MGILLIVLVVFALTGIVAAVWGFVRPPPDGPPAGGEEPPRPRKKEP